MFHKKPPSHIKAINEPAKSATGILLQLPFYAGIIGIMISVSENGKQSLVSVLSHLFISVANADTFAVFSFLISAGLVNVLVLSSDGQRSMQVLIIIPAGLKLVIDPSVVAVAIAWGDA